MLEKLGRLVYRKRWAVVGLWAILLVASGFVAPRVTGILRSGGYTIGNSQSLVAYNDLNKAFGYRALTFTVVFTAPPRYRSQLVPRALAFRRQATTLFGRTLAVDKPVWTPDHAVLFERISSAPQEDLGAHFAAPLRDLLPHGVVRGYLSGPSSIFHDMETVSDQDLHRVEVVTLPLAALVLLLIFGSLVASATPVLMAPVAVTLALALIYFIGQRVDMSIFVLNIASMLGLGVAIDYSLFMVNRFREELTLGRDLETAVANTVATSGRAMMVSAIVVSTGFYALTLSGVQMLQSLGIGGSLVTALSWLVAITLLPAILGILGPRINLFPVIPRRLSNRRIWRAIATRVMRWPIPIIGLVTVVIAVLATPAFHLRPGVPGPEILPPSVDSRAGNDLLNRHLGALNQSPVLVVVERKSGTRPSTFQATAFTLIDRICSSPQVVGISSTPNPDSPKQVLSCPQVLDTLQTASPRATARARSVAARQRIGLIAVFLTSDPSSVPAERYVSSLRKQPQIPGYRVLIGGQTAGQMDFNQYLYSRFPLIALFVIVTIYVVLFLAFKSVLLPLKAVLMNVFSVLAAYGVVVFAFQDGHLAGPLGFTASGSVDSIVPVLLYCVLFGISTDYEVFLLARVQEEYLRSGNNEESVATGIEVTGRIITSAAAVMIVVFVGFAFARLLVIKEVGLGLAAAVFVDATLIRALLVPATMRVLGRWNWWLPFRGFPRIAEAESASPPERRERAG